ncbi:chloride channel protein [Mucilaginibacter sp. SMC90]|uniref:chloride channel protein n=1 Tax=Mucilaginibacter sp. SMC90 TaxID=2929803 RepID=UPI001FB201E8|nr:chloride channel protein [Mucilaginibacter sp. SMC90]UOE47439.1 chloride channel protein [Mucilaginibacter sp. SMC90]
MIKSDSFSNQFEFKGKARNWSIALIGVGILGVLYGFLSGHAERTFSNLLLNAYYLVCLCLCGVCITAIAYVSQAAWATAILRITQALGRALPVAGLILFLVVCSGLYFTHAGQNDDGAQTTLSYLYKGWNLEGVTIPGNPNYNKVIAGKSVYMNVPFFLIRLAIYLTVYSFIGSRLRKKSVNEDEIGGMKNYKKSLSTSAFFLVVFMFTVPLFIFDVIMSLEPEWFSTLFAWYNLAGLLVSGFVAVTLVAMYLKEAGYMDWFSTEHLHTLGVLIFGLSIFWCYLWFEQFLLQYYANIPEEAIYFHKRWEPEYKSWFWVNMIINFCVPLFFFMSRDSKRKWKMMKVTCLILIAGHWLDIWQMVAPDTVGTQVHGWYNQIGIIEVCTFAGFAGVFIYAVCTALSKFKLMAPKNHPLLQESLHYCIIRRS